MNVLNWIIYTLKKSINLELIKPTSESLSFPSKSVIPVGKSTDGGCTATGHNNAAYLDYRGHVTLTLHVTAAFESLFPYFHNQTSDYCFDSSCSLNQNISESAVTSWSLSSSKHKHIQFRVTQEKQKTHVWQSGTIKNDQLSADQLSLLQLHTCQ